MNHLTTVGFAVYMSAAVLSYVALMLLSFVVDYRYKKNAGLRDLQVWALNKSPNAPAVTILAPAKNEEKVISESIKAFLTIPYPNLQLLIVDDGSTDRTFEIIKDEYKLYRISAFHEAPGLRYKPILSFWASSSVPRLRVVRKMASDASKGDANNAGLAVCTTPLVFVTDIDSVVEPDAITKMVVHMENRAVDAVGCPLRILNGCGVRRGVMKYIRLPKTYWELSQVAEYARTFQLRQGWDCLGMLNNISGAAGLFKVAALLKIGGYRPDTTAEDLASTFGLHLAGIKISIEPGVNVYTQVPDTMLTLRSQRKRWARGLFDILWDTRRMLNPKYGRHALLAYWLWVFELLEPFVETTGLIFIIAKVIVTGMPAWAWGLLAAGIATTVALSVVSILQRERLYGRFTRKDTIKIALLAFLEIFPFKIPLSLVWRIVGTVEYLLGDKTWEALPRQNFMEAPNAQ